MTDFLSPFDGNEVQDHNLNVFEYLGAGHSKEFDTCALK